jgi:hypothetical protein
VDRRPPRLVEPDWTYNPRLPLAAGTCLGAYEILGPIGAGGMGEVYRARDTRLGRDVAIKVLPDLFARDPERLERFDREARLLAALNHPNIAHIHGVELAASTDGGTVRALVMEFADGETLAERIARGPVPVDEALPIARQIADALEAAHEAGIVHRDLKPANIKVRPDGTVKVLDFGLAKALEPHALSGSIGNSPTFTTPGATGAGVILGTAAYMSPEQARGKAADARTDLWAFGVIVYEMLAGKPLFEGATLSELLAAVLRDGPKWDALPADTPPSVRTLLRRCLQKDPQLRLRHAGDARLELIDPDGRVEPVAGAAVGAAPTRYRALALAMIPLLILVGVAAYFAGTSTSDAPDVPLRRWVVPLQSGDADAIWFSENVPALSHDGQRLAYVDGPTLRIRSLSSLSDREIPGQGVAGLPVWSPDSGSLVYFLDHKSLWKVSASDGAPTKICNLPAGVVFGLVWRRNGTILVNMAYGPRGGEIFRVPDTGGTLEKYPVPGSPEGKVPIVFGLRGLPDGGITYSQMRDGKLVSVLEREGGDQHFLNVPTNTGLVYSPSGHLLFSRREAPGVFAIRFDLATATVTGDAFRVVEDGSGASVSADGTLAYSRPVPGLRQLTWFNRSGSMGATIGQPQNSMWSPAISPDATRVAVVGVEGGTPNIWTHDIARGGKSRLTLEGIGIDPAWHPSGSRVAYQNGNWDVMSISADGGTPEVLVRGSMPEYTPGWSRDGRYFLFGRFTEGTTADIWMLETGAKEPRPVVNSRFLEGDPTLSPDGRYIAYDSDETGQREIFVRSFPEGNGRTQVSFRGGRYPRWSPKGDEIFFVEGRTLMAARVRAQPAFSADAPERLFDLEERAADLRIYDALDSQRFIVVRTLRRPRDGVVITQNWASEFAGR